jgi:Skp family chaperone for outer membrane proteins
MADSVDSTRRDVLSLGALTAGAAFGAALLKPAVARADGNLGLRVGLVDIGVVFKAYKRKDDLEKEINSKKEGYENQAKAQEGILDGIRQSMRLMDPKSDLFRQKAKELKLAGTQDKVIRDGWEEELKIQVENLTLMILNEIEDRVRKFGTDNKYDLIIKIDSQGWGDERFQERIFRAQVSSVLFFTPSLDVTQDVLKLLNDPDWIKHCQEKPQGAPASTPDLAPPAPTNQKPK